MPDLYAELRALGPRRIYEPPLPTPDAEHVLVKVRNDHPFTPAAYRLLQYYVLGQWPRGGVTYFELNKYRVAEVEAAMRELPNSKP